MLLEVYEGVFEKELLQDIMDNAKYEEIEAGEILIDFKQYVRHMPLFIDGAIKVLREDEAGEEGAELLLYFIEKGSICAFSLSCCIGKKKSEVRAIAEVDSKLLMIPVEKMEEWLGTYKGWRDFVFNSYQNRLDELLDTIDILAFQKMYQNLLSYLKEKSRISDSNTLSISYL